MGSVVHSISMKVIAALTTLSILAAPAMSKNMGSINVKDYGEVFVCAPDWAAGQIEMHDNGFTMRGDSRLYFCNRAVDGWDANAYWQTPLMDKHFAYTLDLSNVGCHCNAAAYFIQSSGIANTWMGQDGKDASFGMCNDGGYIANMASSYGGMVFSASLWGGHGIDMGWLDGVTGCGGECNIEGSSVTFTNFELWA